MKADTQQHFAITSRFSGRVLFEGEFGSLTLCVEAAVSAGADLAGAYLVGADLADANLADANLADADLRGANLSDADLRGANLARAVLRDADLRGANLARADLRGANLSDADLSGAVLRPIEADLYHVLVGARAEVPGLLKALREGRVDGSTYHGECACLVGTIANVRGVSVDDLARDSSRPIERFFLGIKKGDTPATNPLAKLAEEWIVKFLGGEPASLSSSVEG